MAFVSLTFLALLACGSIGLPQAKANCGAFNSDIWKDGKASSGGSCARPSLEDVVDDIPDTKDSDSEEENVKGAPNEEARTEAKGSSFLGFITKLINFVWMIYKWFSNTNNK